MSAHTSPGHDQANWLARVDQLGPTIADHAARCDAEESFVAESFQLLRKEGFFKALVPAELGGPGADYREICHVIRRLATYCGSTALAFSMHSHLVALPAWRWRNEKAPVEALLRRVVGDNLILISSGGADWLSSGGTATKVDGGFRIRGRKPFASGCPLGDVLMTSAVFDDPAAGPTVLHFGVPFTAPGMRIVDTWHVMGMRGTGSNDVELESVFVPEAAIAVRRPAGKWHPLFHAICMIAFPLVYSAYVGVAEAARQKALDLARRRKANQLDLLVGRMEQAFATTGMAFDRMIAVAETCRPGPATTAQAIFARSLAGRSAIETVECAMQVVGGSSFYREHGLERAFRDVQGARFHPPSDLQHAQFAGRLALGLDLDG